MHSEEKWANMTDKKISFIIVNHNYKEHVRRLLSSLEESCLDYNYEVLIVDNASTDGSREYFEKETKVIYKYMDANIGFGAANNIGVALASASTLVLLNPDTLVEKKGFDRFIFKAMDQNENIGVLAPKIVYPDGKIQPNCADYSTFKTFMLQSFKVGYLVRKYNLTYKLKTVVDRISFLKKGFVGTYLDNFSEQGGKKECDWVSGACMIMQKKVFQDVNGFDENFFLYCEDEDLCRRVAEEGYRIVLDPNFTLVHNEGYIKSRKNRALTFAAMHRYQSSIYYLKKHVGTLSAVSLRLFYIVQHLFNGIRYLFVDWSAAKTYFVFLPDLMLPIKRRGQ